MARTEKNTVDYFPFLCKEGKAMYVIEQKHGNDGFATWVKTLRQLAVTNYHYLNLSKDDERMFLASKCGVTEEKLMEICTDLSKLGEFDRHFWETYKVIWSDKFMLSVQKAYEKRKNKTIQQSVLEDFLKGNLTALSSDVIPQKVVGNTQRKEKNIKEKKRKVTPEHWEAVLKIYDEVVELFPNETQPDTRVKVDKWLDCIDQLLRIDKIPALEIITVIKWTRGDVRFWAKNFLSILKLRKTNKEGVKYFFVFKAQMPGASTTKNEPAQKEDTAEAFFNPDQDV